jgi:hypothetical protein
MRRASSIFKMFEAVLVELQSLAARRGLHYHDAKLTPCRERRLSKQPSRLVLSFAARLGRAAGAVPQRRPCQRRDETTSSGDCDQTQ